MNNIALRYAESLFELGMEENKIEQYSNDLTTIKNSLDAEIVDFFKHPLITFDDKMKIIDQSFKDNVNPYVLNFLKLLVQKHRFNEILAIINAFKQLHDEHLGIQRGFLYTAKAISVSDITSIEEVMSKKEKTKVKLQMIVDTSLIGGIKVVINGHVVDGSIQNRLSNMKKDLLNGKVGE